MLIDQDSGDLVAFDQCHIWHPYSPTPAAMDPLLVERAQGVLLYLSDGTTLIDGMSSWWAAAHGHNHPKIVAAAQHQITQMSHVMFGGLTHRPAIRLAKKLLELAPDHFQKVFFSDSGSVSVEVAMKMALQYQRGIGHPERTTFVTWRGGYHGDTLAPMSVCDPEGGMHSLWSGILPQHTFAPIPPPRGSSAAEQEAYLAAFADVIEDHHTAVIIEPVVQGAGGMRFHDPALLHGLKQLCDEQGLLLIVDEIATGFGRTGELFASEDIKADIMCVGKALTGGFMSLAATLTTHDVAAAIQTPQGGGALMHGPTFMANPLACSVAAASLELVASGDWRAQVAGIEQILTEELMPIANQPGVRDVRVLGAIGVIELEQPVNMRAATHAAVSKGVWLRPFGRLIYCMPPFISTREEVVAICNAMIAATQASTSASKTAG